MAAGIVAAFMLGARSSERPTATGSTPTTEQGPGGQGSGGATTAGVGASPNTGAATGGLAPSRAPGGDGAREDLMPAVVGMVLQDAQDLLQSQGSYLMDQVDATGDGRIQFFDSNWRVCTQDPAAGAPLKSTDVVTLGAVKLDESCP